jgi:hypothetical protein
MLNQAVRPRLTKRIGRLDELAHNPWWSWHHQARDLFRILDYHLYTGMISSNSWKSTAYLYPVRKNSNEDYT